MPRVNWETVLPCTPQEAWDLYHSPGMEATLVYPGMTIDHLSGSHDLKIGRERRVHIRRGLYRLSWTIRTTELDPPHSYRDTATQSSFLFWTHLHEFLPHPDGTMMRDAIDLIMPYGPFGPIFFKTFFKKALYDMVQHRHGRMLEEVRNRQTLVSQVQRLDPDAPESDELQV